MSLRRVSSIAEGVRRLQDSGQVVTTDIRRRGAKVRLLFGQGAARLPPPGPVRQSSLKTKAKV